ncbi:M6 family metalloprotease domain-containing protein [Fibrobacter sp.]|uniref:M6 family metalloprotease domain-containing protein n=1 Tax=Fibrobacter sp. TaxID=35828 RepID=UPI0025C48964|nr:M6 family metalloprotease domain-containing protein [Fibrobacter sp.]MBR3071723.1 M6 family metalloprotease domain-containing protein [Fibrobacter sp.]
MKFFPIAFLVMTGFVCSMAEPASDETFNLKQPDGSTVEVRLVGDERFHVFETADGYILQKDVLGYYAYADESGESSGIYARNAHERSSSDAQFLAKLDPDAIFKKMLAEAPDEDLLDYGLPKFAYPRIQRLPTPNLKLTKGDIRGIVVLVQFSDVKFASADPNATFRDFLNKEGYNENHNVGSVRDFFITNSMGEFRPTFDVYGPITVPGTREYYGGKSQSDRNYNGAREAFKQAVDTLMKRGEVDFSKYDNDSDKVVDFIYFIYAGIGASSSGVIETIWPHAGYIGNKSVGNGLRLNRYACSNEISGSAYKVDNHTTKMNGIATFAHEFSHVLGLPDLYDLGGKNPRKVPHSWDLMSNGSYNCPSNSDNIKSCAPPLYSAFERMSVGWMAAPIELNVNGPVRLVKIDSNVAYSVTNPENPNEMFLLEYRTRKKWDSGQTNSGMLIWHIDYVASVWSNKTINNDGDHMHVDIEEAWPETSKYAAASDPFPGSKKVTEFNKFIFWNGRDMNIALSDITESADREYVTFNVTMTVTSSSSEESSSSSELSSSSSVSSSSSIGQESSSSEPVSSSAVASSSSEMELSSSAEFSSSSEISSSSQIESSSSVTELSSSSAVSSSSSIEQESSSSEWILSSSEQASSSSEEILSSSSEGTTFAAPVASPNRVQVAMHDGVIHMFTPVQGLKNVRIFSPNGLLLYENVMDGTECQFALPRHLGKQNIILSVSQGKKSLFMGMIISR